VGGKFEKEGGKFEIVCLKDGGRFERKRWLWVRKKAVCLKVGGRFEKSSVANR